MASIKVLNTTMQKFLRSSMLDMSISQTELAARLGWTIQNLNYRLRKPGASFASLLYIAEGMGLACKVGKDGKWIDESRLMRAVCTHSISSEALIAVLESVGCRLGFKRREKGDVLYVYTKANREKGVYRKTNGKSGKSKGLKA